MIISRTPFRISFFGGGTDYPAWYREHGGAALVTTINRYCYLNCRFLPPFFDHKSRVVWSQIEQVGSNGDIRHPVVRTVLDMLDIREGVEIHHDGDLPSRTGLGSSSAFTVGLLHALHALKGNMLGKADMARAAIHVEQDLLQESVGVQDQIATAFGGLNLIQINRDDSFAVHPLTLPGARMAELQSHVMMFYTGVSRVASEVAKDKIAQIPRKQTELQRMQAMVPEAVRILADGGDISDFGRLLHEAWQIKRTLSDKVAPAFVDEIYAAAMQAGALGGKLLGAGGGGFMIFFAPPDRQPAILAALDKLLQVPIEFEHNGSQIIFYDREQYAKSTLVQRDVLRFGVNGTKGH